MVFKCQEDSFLKEFASKVVACNEAEFEAIIDGAKKHISGYEVILEDTILFPEGGGQPNDLGYLGDIPVLNVIRRGAEAVHHVREPLSPGQVVQQKVEWTRRFDHMQQHSGQHLLSAVIERECKIPTVSWWLGEDNCHVELDTPKLTVKQIAKTEEIINNYISDAIPVTVAIVNKNASEEDPDQMSLTRGLPDDHVGDIRVINIHGVDKNMCCGTHVTNLSQLQVIKLLHTEKSKRKNKTLLYFLVGNRVLKTLTNCLGREQKLTVLLNNGPAEHVDLIDKLIKNAKITQKNLQIVLRDVAVLEVQQLTANPMPKYYFLHKKEGDANFLNTFLRVLGNTPTFLFLVVGDDKTGGNIILYGQEEDIAALGNKICEILEGKGAGKGNRFQAKVANIVNLPKALKLVKEHFK